MHVESKKELKTIDEIDPNGLHWVNGDYPHTLPFELFTLLYTIKFYRKRGDPSVPVAFAPSRSLQKPKKQTSTQLDEILNLNYSFENGNTNQLDRCSESRLE